MKISPLRTVPLRLRLLAAKQLNAEHQRRIGELERKYSRWSDLSVETENVVGLSSWIHPYPGLGHQLAGWISGHLWAGDLGLRYTGGDITRDEAGLFNFGQDTSGLVHERIKKVRLVAVGDERDARNLAILKGQVNRALLQAQGRPVHFQLALDQARWDQTPAASAVRSAVLNGRNGPRLRVLEGAGESYIAAHIRRGDVGADAMGGSTGQPRWVGEDWYVKLLRRIRQNPDFAAMEVRVYALGEPSDFPMLQREGVTLCLNGDRDKDFVELCAAKVLIVAPSSFSFTAGLASQGAVIAQHPWWHHVPDEGRWLRANSDGVFNLASLERATSDER